SGGGEADGRRRRHPRPAGCAGLRADFLRRLSDPGHICRYRGDPGQSAAAAPMSAAGGSLDAAVAAPKRRRRHIGPVGLLAAAVVLFWLVMALVGPLVAPYDVGTMLDADVFDGFSRQALLGTDYLGRDILSRI